MDTRIAAKLRREQYNLFGVAELAEESGVNVNTLRTMIRRGVLPRPTHEWDCTTVRKYYSAREFHRLVRLLNRRNSERS